MNTVRNRVNIPEIVSALLRGETYSSIASDQKDKYGVPVTRNVIAGIKRDLKAGKQFGLRENSSQVSVKTYTYGVDDFNGGLPVFTGHPLVDLDRVMVIADLHLPYCSYKFVENSLKVLRYYGIKDLIIAGDLLNGDSRHHKRTMRTATQSEQNRTSREVLKMYLENGIDHIHLLPGNHDSWLVEDTDGEISIGDVFRLAVPTEYFDRVTPYPYDRIQVQSGSELWTIPHQKNVSPDPLKVGRELALQFQSNIITTHQHLSATGFDKYNRYYVISIGGLHDAKMFDYVNLKTSNFYHMNMGLAVIMEGSGELITPDHRQTDWRRFGGW